MKFITKLRQARRLSSKWKHSSAADREHEFCSTLDDNGEKRNVICRMLRKRKILEVLISQNELPS